MKKSLLAFVVGLLVSVSVMAQSKNEKRAIKTTNKKIAQIEKTVELTDTEKEAYADLYKVYILNHFELKGLKESDRSKFKEEVKKNNKDLKEKLASAVGKERADEIINASKGKNKKKRNK